MKRALLFYLTSALLLQLQESEKKLNRSLQEVKNVEFEIEEATSRKKVNKAWLVSVFMKTICCLHILIYDNNLSYDGCHSFSQNRSLCRKFMF